MNRLAAAVSRRDCTRMSSTSPFRVDRAPEPMLDAVHLEDDLVEVPPVGRPGPITADLRGDLRPELRDPDPDRFMGHGDAALGEKILDITQAQGKAVIRPDGVTDDGARKPMPLEARETVEVQHSTGLSGLRSTINLTIFLSLRRRCPPARAARPGM